MGVNDTVFGTPPATQIHQTPATRDPGYGFARDFFNSLLGMAGNTPFPTYTGQIDPGLSPTMQDLLRRSQGYAGSGMPEIMAGVQGSLGRFMNPSFINPSMRAPLGAPNYFPSDPSQRIFGGQTIGSLQNELPALAGGGMPMYGYGSDMFARPMPGGNFSQRPTGMPGSSPPPMMGGQPSFSARPTQGRPMATAWQGRVPQPYSPGGSSWGMAPPGPPPMFQPKTLSQSGMSVAPDQFSQSRPAWWSGQSVTAPDQGGTTLTAPPMSPAPTMMPGGGVFAGPRSPDFGGGMRPDIAAAISMLFGGKLSNKPWQNPGMNPFQGSFSPMQKPGFYPGATMMPQPAPAPLPGWAYQGG